jgi:hypothetical protein
LRIPWQLDTEFKGKVTPLAGGIAFDPLNNGFFRFITFGYYDHELTFFSFRLFLRQFV